MTTTTLAPTTEGTASATAASATATATATVQLAVGGDWLDVCPLSVLIPGRGVAALLPDGRQAAVFRDRAGRLYAVDNTDPFTGASVLSRGLFGSDQGRPFVASPLLKQRFDLETGRCLDEDGVAVAAFEVRAA
ncbi:nitrite reductase small subunit NirD [Streptomyces beihaiensis]|uniref:Nitrite reductase small subunit NirD n=1 Tax=Streptomyces beihaiensis TaxID=2984495 RepID=A0ABT3TRB8_9ACTN|nr:nitrite reductase small subunit NirD [Streptomyces beihaiensis]MCX3058645.1 nitrite reductase small subunit NirD [Streptomyces beihaiensis]